MPENLSTTVLVQLESVGRQYVHARLTAPWSSQSVGANWKEIEPKLRQLAEKELARAAPRKWLMANRLSQLPQILSIPLELPPPQRNTAWTKPIALNLQGFRWDLDDGMSLIAVPALSCELYAKADELNAELIEQQVHISLVRLGDRFDLLDVRKRFWLRQFSYQLMTVATAIRAPGASAELDVNDTKAQAARQRKATATLRTTASDLGRAELEPVFGRDQAALDIAEYLSGQTPQSVLLVGPAGVGKTAIVHQLVRLVRSWPTRAEQDHDSLGSLSGRKIWSTTGSRLVSGMSGMGMWQERCIKLIREAHATKAILHVGSLIELMEAGKIEGQPGVASMIRQAIARGRLVIIGECTPEQINLIERDEPLLLRALVRYDVTEPSASQVNQILSQAARHRTQSLQRKHQAAIEFSDAALEELSRLHRRYASYSALPAQPLRLMQSILERSQPGAVIQAADVARAFAAQTGLPNFLVDDSIDVDLTNIRQRLTSHVIGQDEPIDLVVNLIATLKSRMVRPGKPLATMLFIGPTGVGKTEMAKAIAGLLYSDTRRMVRIDMSEYATPWSAVRLIGRPDEGDGTLTSPIREQPFSVVLLDEFEKADATVFDMLLQLLGEGRLTDSLGRLADFRNAVVIMTSNLGVDSFRESGFGFNSSGSDWRSHFEREVQRFVRPELLGRIDRIVQFAPLPPAVVRKIAQREVDLLKERPGLKYADIQLRIDAEVIDHLANVGYQPKYGARPLRRVIERDLTVPLANTLAQHEGDKSLSIQASLVSGQIIIAAQRIDTKPEQPRDSIEQGIDFWQKLGRMARMATECGPLRDLENETDRLKRLNDSLFERLKSVSNSRRSSALKAEIQQNAVKIERNGLVIAHIHQASAQINTAHAQVMLDWYNNRPIQTHRLHEQPEQLQSQLRTAVVELLNGRSRQTDTVSLMIIGKPLARAAVLWRSYQRLAKNHNWTVQLFSLKLYDSNRDRESAEFRKRQSQRRGDEADPAGEKSPVFRLLARQPGSEPTTLVKACDVYRDTSDEAWQHPDSSLAAIAIQIEGDGAIGWLQDEHGVIHFVDSSAAGPKRRQRFRVQVEPKRLIDITLDANWSDPVASPERDPRRLFYLTENSISDGLSGANFPCGNSKFEECLLELIREEREKHLWEAIDFTGIPAPATLLHDDLGFIH